MVSDVSGKTSLACFKWFFFCIFSSSPILVPSQPPRRRLRTLVEPARMTSSRWIEESLVHNHTYRNSRFEKTPTKGFKFLSTGKKIKLRNQLRQVLSFVSTPSKNHRQLLAFCSIFEGRTAHGKVPEVRISTKLQQGSNDGRLLLLDCFVKGGCLAEEALQPSVRLHEKKQKKQCVHEFATLNVIEKY